MCGMFVTVFLEFQLFALFLFCFAILSADGPWQIDHVVGQPVIFFSECYHPDNEADMSGGVLLVIAVVIISRRV